MEMSVPIAQSCAVIAPSIPGYSTLLSAAPPQQVPQLNTGLEALFSFNQ